MLLAYFFYMFWPSPYWKLHSTEIQPSVTRPFFYRIGSTLDTASLGFSSIISIVCHARRVLGTVGNKMATLSVSAVQLNEVTSQYVLGSVSSAVVYSCFFKCDITKSRDI
jgi:hypothetical protein